MTFHMVLTTGLHCFQLAKDYIVRCRCALDASVVDFFLFTVTNTLLQANCNTATSNTQLDSRVAKRDNLRGFLNMGRQRPGERIEYTVQGKEHFFLPFI